MLNNTKTQSRPKLLFLVPAISQTHKSLENSQDFCNQDSGSHDKDEDQDFIFFVLEAPRDQDFGLEDYITASYTYTKFWLDDYWLCPNHYGRPTHGCN